MKQKKAIKPHSITISDSYLGLGQYNLDSSTCTILCVATVFALFATGIKSWIRNYHMFSLIS